jgi:hypothetical protein
MKKILPIILSLVIIIPLQASAQLAKIDSMKYALNNAMNDSDKIKLLSDIADPYMWNMPDTAIKYAMQAWQLSLKSAHPENPCWIRLTYFQKH